MSAPQINGYLLVAQVEPGTAYWGPDRAPWDCVDAAYYEQTLPDEVRAIYEGMRSDETRGLWWPTSRELRSAALLRDFSQQRGTQSEIIAVHSPYLAQSQGRGGWTEPRASFLGVDVVSVGEWSLLRALHDSASGMSEELAGLVNRFGLLGDTRYAPLVERHYRKLAAAGAVEPIADVGSGVPVEPVIVLGLADTDVEIA